MATFTPPTHEIANATVDSLPIAKKCMRHFARPDQGVSVYLLTDGSVVEGAVPEPIYTGGDVTTWPEDRIARFFQGAVTHEVTAAEAALLEAAGYEVDA